MLDLLDDDALFSVADVAKNLHSVVRLARTSKEMNQRLSSYIDHSIDSHFKRLAELRAKTKMPEYGESVDDEDFAKLFFLTVDCEATQAFLEMDVLSKQIIVYNMHEKGLFPDLTINDTIQSVVVSNTYSPFAVTLRSLSSIAVKIGFIRELCLCQCGIGDDGLEFLIDEIKASVTLTKLALCCNNLSDASAIRLKMLATDTSVKDLALGGNRFTERCAFHFAELLKKNTTLTTLRLPYTKLRDAGAIALATGLKTNTTLTHLDLSKTSIQSIGCKALLSSAGPALRRLQLNNNNLGDEIDYAFGLPNLSVENFHSDEVSDSESDSEEESESEESESEESESEEF